ncbi:MAG: PorT family protein [Mediterranea sp.]|nr:PorT family protein [Mediterranea sp.]
MMVTFVFGQQTFNDTKKVSYGIRAGFNSSMYLVSNFVIKDVTIDEVQNNYRVGYGVSLFSRFNINKHFIHSEASYNVSLCEIVFDKLGGLHPDIKPDYASISSKIRYIAFPLLYGYNIVKSGPYGMSVFGGPQLRYIWNKRNEITFDNFDQEGIQEVLYPFNISLLAGVAITISPIFFDFRYEQGLNNISKSVTYNPINDSGERESKILLPRKDHVLSFSFGIMF